MARPSRAHMAAVVTGATLGILALVALQVVLPLTLGAWGLAATVLLDLVLCLTYRHHRIAHRRVPRRGPRYPLITWGPVDRRYATRRVDALEKEITATAVVGAVVAVLLVVSLALRIDATAINLDGNLYIAGAILGLLSFRMAEALLFFPLPTEAERFDTTDDH